MSYGNLTFEERFRVWSDSHPRMWEITYDGRDAYEFVSAQVDRMVKTQQKAADSVIVSHDRIASGINEVALGISRVAEGIESLGATFEWGFSELVWQIEEQRKVLQEILEVLQAPLDTQARELKKRAEAAYRNGWFDDALQDFLESEKKNRYDFTIHHNLGNIYFFEKKNPEKALDYYLKAVKYATPKSSYHASIALLHVGLIKYLQGDLQKAYHATSQAISLSPEILEAHYQHAQYCAILSKYDEALEHLQKAIQGDRLYCIKANLEKDFSGMREQLREMNKKLRNRAQSMAESEIRRSQDFIKGAELYDSKMANKLTFSRDELNHAVIFFERRSYYDSLDAIQKARNALSHAKQSFNAYLSKQVEGLSKQISEVNKKITKWEKMDWDDPIWLSIPKWGSLMIFLFVLSTCGLWYAITIGIPSALHLAIRGVMPSYAEINADPVLVGQVQLALNLSFVALLVSWPASYAVKRSLSRLHKKPDTLKLKDLKKKLSRARRQISLIKQ